MKKAVLAFSIGIALAGCDDNSVTSKANSDSTQTQVQAEVSAASQYQALVESFFKEYLKLEPLDATFIGVNDYNGVFGNNLTEEYLKARHDFNSGYLQQARKIDRSQLPADLQLSYDLFVYDRNMALTAETFPSRFLPMNQFYSTMITMVQLGSGESAQPFATVQDYLNWESRVDGFIEWLALAEQRMQEGMASTVVLPRVLVERMIPQFKAQQVEKVEDSVFYAPIAKLPEDFSEEDKAKLTAQYQSMIKDKLLPAMAKIEQFLSQTYLPAARATDGWWGLPNGKQWYQHLANMHTTTDKSVDEIHQTGLNEVARILSEMDKVRQQVGFDGDLKAFFASLSSESQYFFDERQGLIDGYMQLKDKINAVLPSYFNVKPKADYVVKPVEGFREQSAAGASYEAPAVDGSRPGVFYINTFNLKAQPKWGMTTLSLHEAAPGHHFQIAIKQELTGVPEFQRFSGYTAFEEGWALYAEYLGIEMGLFTDPYQYFGKLSDEMLRAMRLVVDTGLHAKGWSREQAIQYMKDNSPMAESDIVAEVERYMAIPGQALSYKVGQLKILELRAHAEKELGEKFDLKAFHDQILTSGSLPMAVMEQKIERWIASLR
ncbi:DUF885 domain-containing protein [Shewanella cyperi]|uniref:DUF885 domain-containing protein n=1 Tax=Shewanella cyperi TaxID=2814292 RepID=UPI001A943050|nr:DUF885 domain-containing protein [Shewanella cyperi]QSX42048.1 DUF885 domain-containing protein [Shewanella cyperi]